MSWRRPLIRTTIYVRKIHEMDTPRRRPRRACLFPAKSVNEWGYVAQKRALAQVWRGLERRTRSAALQIAPRSHRHSKSRRSSNGRLFAVYNYDKFINSNCASIPRTGNDGHWLAATVATGTVNFSKIADCWPMSGRLVCCNCAGKYKTNLKFANGDVYC